MTSQKSKSKKAGMFPGITVQHWRRMTNGWTVTTFLVSLLVALPLLVIVPRVFSSGDDVWRHVLHSLVPGYVTNTVLLMVGVGLLTAIIGVATAWLVTMYRFPGRRFFEWALILPISIPAYINGFTWSGILDYTSPVYVFVRNHTGIDTGPYLFFNLLSLAGAILILSLSLYPYVYLITRAYFLKQSTTLFEVGASLGRGPVGVFFRVVLPLARPAIVAGVSLVLMEVLNDYGLMRYFGIETFTTGIFTAWFAFGSPLTAMKLSVYLMIFVLALILLERYQRGQMRFDLVGTHYRPVSPRRISRHAATWVILSCSLPLLAGFVFPLAMLLYWSVQTAGQVVDARFWELLMNSFFLAVMAAALVAAMALFIAFTLRTFPTRLVRLLARISTLGYAIPGAVVAIGIMVFFLWTEQQLRAGLPGIRIMLTGTWFILVFAYVIRFMAVGYNPIESGMARVSASLDEAARSLGRSNWRNLVHIHLPLLRGAMLSAVLLVFIDVLKELPLTLILRPFNFDTLAIRAFEYASDERIAEAAPAAVIIILVGLVPVYLLNKLLTGKG